jgi:hypothetical protein
MISRFNMRLKNRQIIGVMTGIVIGTVIFIILSKTDIKIEGFYYNLISPLIIGITLIGISSVRKTEQNNDNKWLHFIHKYKNLFLIIGSISIFVFFLNLSQLLAQPKPYNNGWTDELVKKEIEDSYQSSKSAKNKFPKETRKFIECAINKFKDSISYQEYIDSAKALTLHAQKKYTPIFQECLDIYLKEISPK